MVIAELKKTTEQKMDKSVQAFKTDLAKVRTGRAHTGLLDQPRRIDLRRGHPGVCERRLDCG